MKWRADLERIAPDTDPSLKQARPDSPLCRGCNTHTSALERSVKENLLWHHLDLACFCPPPGSEEHFPPCLRTPWADNHMLPNIKVSHNVLLRSFCTSDSHMWPLKLSSSKAVGSKIRFVFVPLAAAPVFGWDKNSFGNYSYLHSVLWQSEETVLLNDASS